MSDRHCSVPRCGRPVTRRHLMCHPHWRRLPLLLRSRIVVAQRQAAAGRLARAALRSLHAIATRCAAAKGGAA